jgi:hypothetical protein
MSTLPSRIIPQRRGDKSAHQFFLMDLEECQRFVGLVETELELSHSQAAERAFRNADHAYRAIVRFLAEAEHTQSQDEIEQKLSEVAARLDDLRLKLGLHDSSEWTE